MHPHRVSSRPIVSKVSLGGLLYLLNDGSSVHDIGQPVFLCKLFKSKFYWYHKFALVLNNGK